MTEEDPVNNYKIINNELEKYGGRLNKIPQIIALNKIDAADPEKVREAEEYFVNESKEVFTISAATGEGTKDLVYHLIQKIGEIPAPEFNIEVEKDEEAHDHDDSDYKVHAYDHFFIVKGGRVERLVAVTDLKISEATFRLENILKGMGVFKALEDAGIVDGDTVRIGEFEFEYYSD